MTPLFSELVSAYDADYDAIEAARHAWDAANRAALERTRQGVDAALEASGLEAEPAELRQHGATPHRDFVMAVARLPRGYTAVSLRARAARPYGGPGATLRLMLRFRDAPRPAAPTPRRQVWDAVRALPGPLPGEAWQPEHHPDISGDDRPLRVASVPLAGLDAAALVAAVRRAATPLLTQVAAPVLRACDAPFQVSAASTRALESLRPVLASLVGGDDWDVQDLVEWGSSGAVVTGIEDDEHAVYLGLDTARGQLFLTARSDALLERAAALAGATLEPSPYARGDGLLILYRQEDRHPPELEPLARRLFSVWIEDRRRR